MTGQKRQRAIRTPKSSLIIAITVAVVVGGLFLLSVLGLILVIGRDESGEGGVAGGGALSQLLSNAYLWRTWRFTLFQAGLSALLSIALALPVAFALSRRRFPGRALLLQFSTLSFVLPPIVVVFGLVDVLGRRGWLNALLEPLGFELGSWLYGLDGILIAHVFFNAPLAVRYFTGALASTPKATWALTEQLGLGGFGRWRLVDWPQLRAVLPTTALLIFLLCFTSFTLVLSLGGGPATNSLEVSIYEALRFEADLTKASLLGALQVATLSVIAVLFSVVARDLPLFPAISASARRPGSTGGLLGWVDGLVLFLFAALLALPLLSIILRGIGPGLIAVLSDPDTLSALATSLVIAVLAGLLAVLIALSLNRLGAVAAWASLLLLIIPSFVFVTGLFVLVLTFGPALGVRPMTVGPALLVVVNALLAVPFAIRALRPQQRLVERRYNRLCDGLALTGVRRWLLVDAPLLRRPLAVGFGLAAALSLGDFGVIAFFGSESFATLPSLLHQGLSSYRFAHGASLALVLLVSAVGLFALAVWAGGEKDHA